jgi:GNAT superfamily N-acetyltransferase
MDSIQVRQFEPARDVNLLQAVVKLHIDCINFEDALLRYHPPFDEEKQAKMLRFWKDRFDQIPRGLKVTFIATTTRSDTSTSKYNEGGGLELCGLVELGTPEAETGPFRGDVELLMVSPHHRRKGIAKKLMFAMEECARQKGRTLLVMMPMSLCRYATRAKKCSNSVPMPVQQPPTTSTQIWVTSRLCYPPSNISNMLTKVQIGTVPGYGVTPNSKKLVDGEFFYKHLSHPEVR